MKLLVIGGSNSLMKRGYVEELDRLVQAENVHGITQIDNVSVGANGCIRGLESAKLSKIKNYDVVVIEYFINDFQIISRDGVGFWLSSYEGLIRYILSENPAIIIAPLLLGRRDEIFLLSKKRCASIWFL